MGGILRTQTRVPRNEPIGRWRAILGDVVFPGAIIGLIRLRGPSCRSRICPTSRTVTTANQLIDVVSLNSPHSCFLSALGSPPYYSSERKDPCGRSADCTSIPSLPASTRPSRVLSHIGRSSAPMCAARGHEPARLRPTSRDAATCRLQRASVVWVAPAGIHRPVRRGVRRDGKEPDIAVRLLRRHVLFGRQAITVSTVAALLFALRGFADALTFGAALRAADFALPFALAGFPRFSSSAARFVKMGLKPAGSR